ncbi:hypothetical protein ACRAWD_13925 [Caulobacter segnis]
MDDDLRRDDQEAPSAREVTSTGRAVGKVGQESPGLFGAEAGGQAQVGHGGTGDDMDGRGSGRYRRRRRSDGRKA